MTRPKDAQPYHHGDLRNALLLAAEQLLAEQGAASLSLRAVAKRAGVSHAAPYRHFRDKAVLSVLLARSRWLPEMPRKILSRNWSRQVLPMFARPLSDRR